MDHTEMMSQHPSFKEEKMSYAYTWAKEDTFNFKWTIKNFEFCVSKQILKSPEFGGRKENDLLWYLQIEKGVHEHFDSYNQLRLSLFLKDHKKTGVYAKFKWLILDNKGNMKLLYERNDTLKCQSNAVCDTNYWRYEKFCNKENGHLSNGTLTLVCKITVVNIVNTESEFCTVPICSLVKDLEDIFEEKKFCDFTFSVGGREFQAHKNILSGRSPVFAAMFNHGFVESKQNSVTITDIDHDVFKEILKFIYTGRATIIETMADKLLMAADKYGLERLKVICEEVLINKISTDNVCEFLLLADKHGANHLKGQTIDFIKNHFANVKNTDGWNNIKDSYPHLLIPMLERCFERISLV